MSKSPPNGENLLREYDLTQGKRVLSGTNVLDMNKARYRINAMMNYKCSVPREIQTFYMILYDILYTTLTSINSLSCISLILLGVLGYIPMFASP